jgi:hypothetical protein
MAMRWHDLGFLHWPVAADTLRPFVPKGLQIDTFDGSAWLGVVPFHMTGVRLRCLPAFPGVGAFAELNLRTYVTKDDKPGVWFFSLDAVSRLAVRVARKTFHLPYFDARIERTTSATNEVRYRSVRTHRGAPASLLSVRYRPTSEPFGAAPGSIEHFLVERYCLYAAKPSGAVYRGEIQHTPWPLQNAECELETNTLGTIIGLELPNRPALVHFAKYLDVRAWKLERSSSG